MLTWFRALDFGCLKDVQCSLSPLHAFVGPNDSGKSTLLRAICDYMKDPDSHDQAFTSAQGAQPPSPPGGPLPTAPGPLLTGHHGPLGKTVRSVGAALVRFDPDALRAPSGLIPEEQQIRFLDDRGRGLPGIYDAILNRGDDAFAAIGARVRQLFPSIKALRLRTVSATHKTLETELLDGTRIQASQFSEGLLYYLAFAALPFIAYAPIVLIEEPENGLHPSRIAEVVRMLREITVTDHPEPDVDGYTDTGEVIRYTNRPPLAATQIVMATHSPLVINELRPEEVTVVTRTAAVGTRLTAMTQTRNFAERSRVYALGELWLSYANGMDEAELVG